MKNIFRYLDSLGLGWIVIWAMIYVGFLLLGMTKDNELFATILKYGGLVLCFIYVLLYARRDVFLVLALGFTVIADGILIYNNVSELGVGVFILVQVAHFLRFSQIRSVSPLIPILAAMLVVSFGFLQRGIPIMFILATAYGILIFTNIYEAVRWYKSERSDMARHALVGFILFFLCDLCVGVSYLTTTEALPQTITLLANYLAWVFYLPSQVNLALSGKRAELEEMSEKA